MSTRNKLLQRLVKEYLASGKKWPTSSREIAKWAINNGRWRPESSVLINQCADQIAQAMREEYITDPQGRKVRAKHFIRIKQNGRQVGFWDDMRWASTNHMQISAQQRRQQIVGDCKQLKTDMDSYNENYNKGKPIQLSFNFTRDLEELEIERNRKNSRNNIPHSRPSINNVPTLQ